MAQNAPTWPTVAQMAQTGPNGAKWPKPGNVSFPKMVEFRSVREKLQFTIPFDHPLLYCSFDQLSKRENILYSGENQTKKATRA